jgi:hypothetical protein
MGIASFSRSPLRTVLQAPLQALAALFAPAQPSSSSPRSVPATAGRRFVPGDAQFAIKNIASDARHTAATGQKTCQTVAKPTAPRRLRIVREFEAGASPSCAGRMVISGRMADVCAALERMA